MPHHVWHHGDMAHDRYAHLRRLGRQYRAALEDEKRLRLELAKAALEAVDQHGEPVGDVARAIGFDREWVRRARNYVKKEKEEQNGES